MADLGVIRLNEADAQGAKQALEAALALARELDDHSRQNDVRGNLGMAMLALGQARPARGIFERVITDARAAGDRFEETGARTPGYRLVESRRFRPGADFL